MQIILLIIIVFVVMYIIFNITEKNEGENKSRQTYETKKNDKIYTEYKTRKFNGRYTISNNLEIVENEFGSLGIYNFNNDTIIIPCKFSNILFFERYNIFLVKEYNSKAYAIDVHNNVIIQPKYDDFEIVEDRYIRAFSFDNFTNKRFSYIIDKNGMELVKIETHESEIWKNKYGKYVHVGIFPSEICELYGSYGIENNYKLYMTVHKKYHNTLVIYLSSARLYNIELRSISDPQKDMKPYTETYTSKPDYLIVTKDNENYGVINLEFEVIIPLIYHKIDYVVNKHKQVFYIVKQNDRYGVLNTDGDVIINIEADKIKAYRLGEETYFSDFDTNDPYYEDNQYWQKKEHFEKNNQLYFKVTKGGKTDYYTTKGIIIKLNNIS